MSEDSRLIILTGATRGIGRALARELATLGHTVVGCGRSTSHIEALQKDPGPEEAFHVIDVTQASRVQTWATTVLSRFGPPDLLINNAAMIHERATVWEVPAEEADPLFDVNVGGVLNVLRAFVPAMIEAGKGVIVNLSSGAGRSPIPGMGVYCASKYAIEGLTLTMAKELPEGLAAIPLSPGMVDTDMLRTTFGEEGASQQIGPDEWAKKAAPFLLGLGPKDNGKSLSTP